MKKTRLWVALAALLTIVAVASCGGGNPNSNPGHDAPDAELDGGDAGTDSEDAGTPDGDGGSEQDDICKTTSYVWGRFPVEECVCPEDPEKVIEVVNPDLHFDGFRETIPTGAFPECVIIVVEQATIPADSLSNPDENGIQCDTADPECRTKTFEAMDLKAISALNPVNPEDGTDNEVEPLVDIPREYPERFGTVMQWDEEQQTLIKLLPTQIFDWGIRYQGRFSTYATVNNDFSEFDVDPDPDGDGEYDVNEEGLLVRVAAVDEGTLNNPGVTFTVKDGEGKSYTLIPVPGESDLFRLPVTAGKFTFDFTVSDRNLVPAYRNSTSRTLSITIGSPDPCDTVTCDPGQHCHPETGLCVDCLQDEDCAEGYCNGNSCAECITDTHCQDDSFCNGSETCEDNTCHTATESACTASQVCDEQNDVCVGCLRNADCSQADFCRPQRCESNTCTPYDRDCGDLLCSETLDACVSCTSDDDCDNGDYCDGTETCDAGGTCQPGADPCNGGLCSETLNQCVQCLSDADCDNGTVCDGIETCNASGACESGTPLVCDNGDWCDGTETCDALLGCQPGTAPCSEYCDEIADQCVECLQASDCADDGQFCTDAVCNAGVCGTVSHTCGGSTPYCDENLDACTECLSNSDCDNGDWCDGSETCNGSGQCVSGTSVNCNYGTCNDTLDKCDCDNGYTGSSCSQCASGYGPAYPTCEPEPTISGLAIDCSVHGGYCGGGNTYPVSWNFINATSFSTSLQKVSGPGADTFGTVSPDSGPLSGSSKTVDYTLGGPSPAVVRLTVTLTGPGGQTSDSIDITYW